MSLDDCRAERWGTAARINRGRRLAPAALAISLLARLAIGVGIIALGRLWK